MSTPQVSVVIATWNTARYLPQTLASVLGQTWENVEVIVVDDGSTDETAAAIEPFRPRIRYERRRHGGLAAARNEGLRLARGEYIALLDADDLWYPEKIAIQVAVARRNAGSGLIVCNGEEFVGDDILQPRLLRDGLFARHHDGNAPRALAGEVTADFQTELITRNLIACPAQILLPRAVVERVGPFVDSGAQDYDYYLRVSRLYPLTFHDEVLARWRFRPESMSGPREERPIRWGLFMVPVLRAHRARCRAEDRDVLERRIRQLVQSLGYEAMIRGRETDRRLGSSRLLELLRGQPWPPRALVYLAALWAPEIVYRAGARLARQRWTPG